ncbi:MAG: CotH kinase family protein, partial [Flavobacteriales bacterium]|nr:CotH kinase family protein [Flavobacteriales bacterium]
LYGPDQVLVDGLVYATQETDISYGRSTDGATSWAWFSPATPGASNNTSNPYDGITYYQPLFSQTGGFFSDPLSVSLTTLGGVIHYTLDGRAPSLADPVYTSAIAFDTTAFIRARVFEDNKIPGPVITHSYFYDDSFAERGLGVVSLVTDPYYFWDPDSGLYVQDFKPEWEWPLNIEFFENDGNNQSVFNLPAGVKINGLWSWQLPQKMLGIYFRNEYGASSLEYPLFADRDRDQFSEFILRAGGSDWSFTLVRDGLCQELIQENAYVHHQGYRHCVVFINGEYMGIHSMRSRTDGEDLEETFGVAEGDYDIINNHGEIEEGTDTEFWEMDAHFNADLSVQANFDSLAAVVDMTDFTDYWATEIWTSNSSWGHNVKLWKPHATGKWKYIFGDLDRGFTGATDNGINEFSIPQGGSDYDYGRTWLQHTFEIDGFVSYFSRRFADHLYTSFHPEYVNRKVDVFTGELVPEIPYHVDRWSGTTSAYGDGIPTVTFWEEEVAALRTFAADRQGYMLADLQQKFGLGNIVALATSSLPAEGGNIHINEFLIPGAPWNGSYFTDMPFSLTASANPGYLFQGWSTFENTLLFDFGADWKFLDNGSNQGTDWTAIDFDDAGWSTGTADFGYGDGDETTVVSYGPNSNNKYITTYFRKEFSYTGEEGTPVSALLNVVRDDGVLVYINGAEVARSNMPAGTVNYQTLATDAIGGAGETAVNAISFDVPLVNGTNTIAVEVHQSAANSSDLSFDASLSINVPAEEIISTSPTLDLALTDNAGYIARYIPTGECLLPDTIAENTTLTIDCSPYLASGDTYVLPGISLSVDPGVEIWFPEEARLVVQGDLQVNGTENAMVLFRENAAFGASSWGNVTIENATAPCHMNYLQLQNATTGTHPIHNRAAISGWYSDIVIDHCVLTENLDNPIFGEYANFTLTNSVVHSPVTGDLINVKYGDAYISDCVFIGNDQVDTDAIDYDRVGNGVIRNSVVHSFFGPNSDAIDLGEECTDVLIENCLLHNCTDKGISCGQSST